MVLWARGVILGLSAMSCCWSDERGNGHCFRRVWWSPGLESINGALRAPRLCPEPEACSHFAPAGPFYGNFTAERKPKSPTALASLCDWPGVGAGVFGVWLLVRALGKSER